MLISYLCSFIFCNLCLMACFLSVIVCTGTERASEPLEAGPEVRPRAYVPVCHLPALLHLLWETLDPALHVLLSCSVDLDLDNHILPPVTALLVAVISAIVWGQSSECYILKCDSANVTQANHLLDSAAKLKETVLHTVPLKHFYLAYRASLREQKSVSISRCDEFIQAVLNVYSTQDTSSSLAFCIFLFWNLIVTIKHDTKKNMTLQKCYY